MSSGSPPCARRLADYATWTRQFSSLHTRARPRRELSMASPLQGTPHRARQARRTAPPRLLLPPHQARPPSLPNPSPSLYRPAWKVLNQSLGKNPLRRRRHASYPAPQPSPKPTPAPSPSHRARPTRTRGPCARATSGGAARRLAGSLLVWTDAAAAAPSRGATRAGGATPRAARPARARSCRILAGAGRGSRRLRCARSFGRGTVGSRWSGG